MDAADALTAAQRDEQDALHRCREMMKVYDYPEAIKALNMASGRRAAWMMLAYWLSQSEKEELKEKL